MAYIWVTSCLQFIARPREPPEEQQHWSTATCEGSDAAVTVDAHVLLAQMIRSAVDTSWSNHVRHMSECHSEWLTSTVIYQLADYS